MLASVFKALAIALPGSIAAMRPELDGLRRLTDWRSGSPESGSGMLGGVGEAVRTAGTPMTTELPLPPAGIRSRESRFWVSHDADPPPAESVGGGSASWDTQNLLSRLRMPAGGKGSSVVIGVPAVRTASPTPPSIPEPDSGLPLRQSVNRRNPSSSGRMAAIEPGSAIASALNTLASINDSGRMSTDDSPMAEIQRLRAENRELRQFLVEMR